MFIAMSNLDQNHRRRQGMLFAAAAVGIGMLIVAFVSGGTARAEAAADAAIAASSDEQALDDASAYLAALENMQGDFLQLGPDGSVAEGKFYLRRPGRLRFEYQPPDNLLVVADGTWVAVKDSSSPAQRYPIASTPLSLFLAANVDLAKTARVLNVESQPGALLITLADRAGGLPARSRWCSTSPTCSFANGSSPTRKACKRRLPCATSSRASAPTMRSSPCATNSARPSAGGSKATFRRLSSTRAASPQKPVP